MKNSPHGNFDVCLKEAQGCLETAQWCVRDFILMPEKMKYPFIINISFACELFIKAIMIGGSKSGTFERGHNIKDLFGKLRLDTQKKIQKSYEEKAAGVSFNESLDRFLSICQNDFSNWRYAFERNELEANGSDYLNFAYCLKKYIEISNEVLE